MQARHKHISLWTAVSALTLGCLVAACSGQGGGADEMGGASSSGGSASGGAAASDGAGGSGGLSGTGGIPAAGGTSGSTSLVPLGAKALCDRLVNTCGATEFTYDECVDIFYPARVTAECTTALSSATCEDLLAEQSVSEDICFPFCSTEETTCNGDGTITFCAGEGELRLLVASCIDLCAQDELATTWTGVCGKTYGAITRPTDRCWCE